eukprot:XP_766732.1 hypothetical protein [Theileria parva strain Muguga]
MLLRRLNYVQLRSVQWRSIAIWKPFSRPKEKPQSLTYEKLIYPNSTENQNHISKLWNDIKQNILIDSKDPDEEAEKHFQFSVQKLLESPGKFTFRKFSIYLHELCTKLKLIGKKTLPEDQITGTLLQLRNQYNMMSYLTEEELDSDTHKVFTFDAKKLIANSLNLRIEEVEEMLMHFDTCKIDRTWYFRRLVLGRKLPTSYKEREFLSFQRPTLRLANQVYPEVDNLESMQIKKIRDDTHYNRPKYV